MIKHVIYRQIRRGSRLFKRSLTPYRHSFYSKLNKWRVSNFPRFNDLLEKISRGVTISTSEILPFISQESLTDRLWINFYLAEAFHLIGKHELAKVFVQRVWLFSGQDEKYLQFYIDIHAACDDVDTIRDAHKVLGMKKADANLISEALEHFNDWQYAYSHHRNSDDYRYDTGVLERISLLAKPYAFPPRTVFPDHGRKLRLAHLMFGLTHSNSVIVEISLLFAKYHDLSKFDVTFYVLDQESDILGYDEAVRTISLIKQFGWDVVIAPKSPSSEESLFRLARAIYDSNADILVTCAGLADLKHYFIASLNPSPLVVGLCQGPAPQFIAPDFHWSITWFRSLVPDCPTQCSFVHLRLDLPERQYSREDAKYSFGISRKNLVVMTSGRPEKLQDSDFLKTLITVVSRHSNVILVVVGLGELPVALKAQLGSEATERVKVFGWVKEFIKVLSMADIVVDTYPSGGGVLVKDAAALGIPVISFKHDYMQTFSQKECSSAEETIGIPELIMERGDFSALDNTLSLLIKDQILRENLSQLCREHILETSSNPGRMIRECEQIFLNVTRQHEDDPRGPH